LLPVIAQTLRTGFILVDSWIHGLLLAIRERSCANPLIHQSVNPSIQFLSRLRGDAMGVGHD
jgi:hypothetical protein